MNKKSNRDTEPVRFKSSHGHKLSPRNLSAGSEPTDLCSVLCLQNRLDTGILF